MKDEFEKLDQFMRKNRPDISQVPLRKYPGLQRFPWTAFVVALSLAIILTAGVVQRHKTEAESAMALSEVLNWDVTSDELPVEMELELAMLD